jgi:hypothetical protein
MAGWVVEVMALEILDCSVTRWSGFFARKLDIWVIKYVLLSRLVPYISIV